MSDPSREIELKFLCAPDDLDAVLAAAPAGQDETKVLVSIYFDTPGGALERAGVSLRVRECGGAHVQTLKRGKGISREEHEVEVPGPELDLGMSPLCDLLSPGDLTALRPVSRVRVTRRQRLILYRGAQIELALDLGDVSAGGRSSPISEVELELKSGPRDALFDLGRELVRAVPLELSFQSKSARGRALKAGT